MQQNKYHLKEQESRFNRIIYRAKSFFYFGVLMFQPLSPPDSMEEDKKTRSA
jgi:hypothetical protein